MNNIRLNEQVLEFIAQRETAGALPPGAGIAVSVVKDGDMLFSGAYGLRDRNKGLPVTAETIFETCSSTKGFTSTALVMASESGQLDLNQPINLSKPLLALSDSDVSQKISIADILSHRTGLPAYDLLWYFGLSRREEVLQAVEKLPLVPGAFRQNFTYNNLMYGALGQLFEELVGESWQSYVTQKILKPLKMTATSFKPTDEEQNVALPYVGTQQVNRIDMAGVAAAGTIRSSIEDMTRWMAFHLNGGTTLDGQRLLSESSIRLMQTKQIAVTNANPLVFQGLEWLGEQVDYGYGWFLGSTRGLAAVYHPGFIDGYSTAVVMIPEKKLGFTVLSNVNLNGSPGLLVQNLLEGLWDDGNRKKTQTAETVSLSAKNLLVTGKYESPVFGTISVSLVGNQLVLDYKDSKWPLTWKGDDTAEFVASVFGLQIPLSVKFEAKGQKATQLSFPFSLDPSAQRQIFIRSLQASAS